LQKLEACDSQGELWAFPKGLTTFWKSH
jgi:hypothetical protein